MAWWLDPAPTQEGLSDQERVTSARWLGWLTSLRAKVNRAVGAFHDTTTQSAAANTPTVIAIGQSDLAYGVYKDGSPSKIAFQITGVYNIQWSLQLSNSAASADNTIVWLRKNGTDVADSAGLVTTPAKHGADNGATIACWNIFLSIKAGDYIQLVWMTVGGTTILPTIPASGSPAYPESPSVILTINQL